MVFFISTIELCNPFFKITTAIERLRAILIHSFLSYSQPLAFQFVPRNTYFQEQVLSMQSCNLISAFHQLFYTSLKNSLNVGKLSLSQACVHTKQSHYAGEKQFKQLYLGWWSLTSKFITNLHHLLMIFIVVDDATSKCRSCIMLHIFYNTGLLINSAGFKDAQSVIQIPFPKSSPGQDFLFIAIIVPFYIVL